MPVLYLVGDEDVIFPPRMIRTAHELTPGSRFVTIHKAGHSAYFERADAFNQVLLDYLDGLPS